jgi:DNA repair ATPase RecN
MADPLRISASLLAVITAAVQSVKSLHNTVTRFKNRDKTLRRLQNELEDLISILGSLGEVIETDMSMLSLLQGPVERCSRICREFEQAMEVLGQKSTTGFRDWAKMEFMRGDINEFIDNIAGYKSTISVGLVTINMLVKVLLMHETLLILLV